MGGHAMACDGMMTRRLRRIERDRFTKAEEMRMHWSEEDLRVSLRHCWRGARSSAHATSGMCALHASRWQVGSGDSLHIAAQSARLMDCGRRFDWWLARDWNRSRGRESSSCRPRNQAEVVIYITIGAEIGISV